MAIAKTTLNILTKTAGATGLALIAYDAHTTGRIISPEHVKEKKTEAITERYLDDLKLESKSIVKQHTKEGIFKYFLDENFSGFFHGVSGYFHGLGESLSSNVIPLGLSLGTFIGKGIISKLSGAGLIAYGGIFLAQEIFGIGKHE